MMGIVFHPPLKVRALQRPWARSVDLHFYQSHDDGSIDVVTTFTMTKTEPNSAVPPDSALSLSLTEAQSLMDELWSCGLRPSEGTGSAGSLAATEKHLKDMRALVAKHLGVTL